MIGTLWQLLWQGLSLGAIYAMAALGFVIIFRSTGVFNFAQGVFMGLGAYLVYSVGTNWNAPYVVAVLVAAIVVGAVSALVYVLTIKPLLGHPWWAPVMITIAVSIVFESLVFGIVWKDMGVPLNPPWKPALIDLGLGASISNGAAGDIVVAGLLVVGMHLLLARTTFGVRLRACAERPLLAAQSGINVTRYLLAAWAIGGVVAALAGIAYATGNLASPEVANVGIRAFPAALLGGFDSIPGVAVGGFVVALAEVTAIRLFGAQAGDATVFGLLLIVLIVRPYGIFGSSSVARV